MKRVITLIACAIFTLAIGTAYADKECCGKDGKCCKTGAAHGHAHDHADKAADAKCCGKDGKCCKEGKACDKDGKCCKEGKACDKDGKCCKEGKACDKDKAAPDAAAAPAAPPAG